MEKYGFIYIWRDKKHKRYYVGCHWGYEDDGYICSSNWMRDAYRRRPDDFKRRIIKKIYTNKKDMFLEEQRYLDMIKGDELGKRYYNLNKTWQHWSLDEDNKLSIAQRISKTKKRFFQSPESISFREEMSRRNKEKGITPPSRKGKNPWNKGLTKENDPRVAAASLLLSKPKSNTEKMGKHGRMPPSQKGKKWKLIDGKRHYMKPGELKHE